MYIILKLNNGEQVIGQTKEQTIDDLLIKTHFDLFNPQIIVIEPNGAMKLRDPLSISDQTHIPIHFKDILTWYNPAPAMLAYYHAVIRYNALMKNLFMQQTLEAAEELRDEINNLEIEITARSKLPSNKKSLN